MRSLLGLCFFILGFEHSDLFRPVSGKVADFVLCILAYRSFEQSHRTQARPEDQVFMLKKRGDIRATIYADFDPSVVAPMNSSKKYSG